MNTFTIVIDLASGLVSGLLPLMISVWLDALWHINHNDLECKLKVRPYLTTPGMIVVYIGTVLLVFGVIHRFA